MTINNYDLNKRRDYRTTMVNLIILTFTILGSVGWFGDDVIASETLFRDTSSIELPLGDLKGIAVDSEGRIYCGLQAYSRIQVYDSAGNFLNGWYLNANSGAFRIRVNSENLLEAATVRNNKLYVFDYQGTLINQKSNVDHYFNDFGESGERFTTDRTHTLYSIRGGMFFPRVVKGRDTLIVTMVWYKWIVMKPFPAWLFMIVAGVIHIFNRKL